MQAEREVHQAGTRPTDAAAPVAALAVLPSGEVEEFGDNVELF